MRRYLLPRLRDFCFILILVGALITGNRMLNVDGDLGRHLAVGSYILTSHHIPTHDILSYTKSGESRPPYEWLAQVLFALSYRFLNLDGVVLLTSLVIAAAFTLLYADSVRRSNAPIVGLLIAAWAAAASSLHWISRPHVFSFLFFALWLALLDGLRRGEKQSIWYFPVLMLVWANTHGGFIFGFLAYTAYLAGWVVDFVRKSADMDSGRRLLAIGGTSLVASVLTPDLWGNWSATLNNHSAFILSQTTETMPVNILQTGVWPFLGLVTLAVILIVLQLGKVNPAHIILVAGLAILAFAMARNIPFFVIGAAPLCSVWLGQLLARLAPWTRLEQGFSRIDGALQGFLWSGIAVVAALGFFVYFGQTTHASLYQLNPRVVPIGAVDWLEKNPPPANMFNDFNWGGYLLFRMWPDQHVYIDSQSDFYGETFIREYAAVLEGAPDWESQLSTYNVGWILIPPSAPLADLVRADPAWKVGYQDSTAIVFVRR